MDQQNIHEDIRGQSPADLLHKLEVSNATLSALWTAMTTCYNVDGSIDDQLIDLMSGRIAANARLIGYLGLKVTPEVVPF